jgi:hypothetical protein
MKTLAIIAAAFIAVSAARAGEATPLFASDEPIEITVSGPVSEIVRKAASSTDPRPATLAYAGETHAIELSARGNARRRPEVCKFPPLRVKFAAPPGEGSLFRKQKSLKLVTHCRAAASFQQTTLLEYAAYGMYNQLTEASFRVRLAKVRYVDEPSGKTVAERLGFFIEDEDDLARRVGMEEVEAGRLTLAQHDAAAAARAVLFFHMIANHDWSMIAGPDGECCHNGKLLGPTKTATEGLVFVPYDFDYSGFVDAPYALAPEEIDIKSVRTRFYRGDCALNDEARRAAALFRERRAAIEGAVRGTPHLEAKTVRKAVKYLAGFFNAVADEAAVEKLLKKCR